MPRDAVTLAVFLATADDTARLGSWLSGRLVAGQCLLLDGPIGSGKTHLARAFIQHRLAHPEDVPSPTFTLVQTYGAGPDTIWHADLYRLSHPDEVIELGLDEAFETAICLIEWPDRLGPHRPQDALTLAFSARDDGREVQISGAAPWGRVLAELAAVWHG